MGNKTPEIKCPHCRKSIAIDEPLAQKLEKLLWPSFSQHIAEEAKLKISEKEQLIDSLKNQLKGMSRKIEQAAVSQQAQGEAGELLLEEFLTRIFPFDNIKSVPKGKKGGDLIQQINTRENQNLAAIMYEVKRCKSFSPGWIPKLKEDLKRSQCMFGIIVSETMPNDSPRMAQIEGIWVCTIHEVKTLSTILREAAILCGNALNSIESSSDKAQLLYQYLISNQFKMEIQAILDSFLALDQELSKEKRSTSLHWKNREANIKKAIKNAVSLYGSFRSIAGNTIPLLKELELPEGETQVVE